MRHIKVYRKIEIENPVMLVAWPGMGNVAFDAIGYLRKKLRANLFAEIGMGRFWTPDAIMVEEGLAKLPPVPKHLFYYTVRPPLIIFEGEAQFSGEAGVVLTREILSLARDLKVRRIYAAAAFPTSITHKDPSEVYGAANMKELRSSLEKYRVKLMGEGQISGLNGVLIGYALKRKIEATCLLATMPFYAIRLSNPKASKAIIEVLQQMLNFRVDMLEMDLMIKEVDAEMELIEKSIREVLPQFPEAGKVTGTEKEKVPDHILKKIEGLFREAVTDRKMAHLLKEELDRWDLYKLYEDRFLDLFKQSH